MKYIFAVMLATAFAAEPLIAADERLRLPIRIGQAAIGLSIFGGIVYSVYFNQPKTAEKLAEERELEEYLRKL